MTSSRSLLSVCLLLSTQFCIAQSNPNESPAKPSESGFTPGLTAFVLMGGNLANVGYVGSETFNIGYEFTPHVAMDIGLPLYTTRTPFSTVETADWRYTTIIGAPYLDLRYSTKYSGTNIVSIATVSGGTKSVKTYSTGRAIVDWYNHFDRSYQILRLPVILTPFLNLGAASGTFDRGVLARPYNVNRPYQNLGAMGNGEFGLTITLLSHYHVGGSLYGYSPVGRQKVFSRLVSPDSLKAAGDFVPLEGTPSHNRWWNDYWESGGYLLGNYKYEGGPARIGRDNGYSNWLEITRFKHVNIDLGYTHSVRFAYGSTFLMLRYDLSDFLRSFSRGE